MSGHNKWSGIKHRKGAQDAKRANVFTKFARLIALAAKEGGGNPESNLKLKFAVEQARSVNMPKDNIERAIKKGTGELKDGNEIEEVIYEAFGPGNVAMMIKCATDNRNRTVGEVKSILTKAGGKFVPEGGVSFMFRLVGNIEIDVGEKDPYELEMQAIELGAEDTIYSGDYLTVYTKPEELWKVREEIERAGLKVDGAGLVYSPLQKTELDADTKIDYEKLLEKLDEHDDVQEIYDNL